MMSLHEDNETQIIEAIHEDLAKECYADICGGAEETKTLLKNRFDHIFYT
ncbi:hypothetical protein cypCar_00029424, partial [Cyprinus carpio]